MFSLGFLLLYCYSGKSPTPSIFEMIVEMRLTDLRISHLPLCDCCAKGGVGGGGGGDVLRREEGEKLEQKNSRWVTRASD